MDACSRRRLRSVLRHVLPPATAARDFHPNVLYAKEADPGCSTPVVIGGMVLDIHAKPFTPAKPGTTTPGKVEYTRGGVARNVAECMSKLGSKPFLISVVGQDMAGDLLLDYWNSAGLPTDGILRCLGTATPVVSSIFDANGELATAVASVEVVEKLLTPDWIRKFHHHISSAPILILDANLSLPSLEAACQIATEYKVPVWFEPVSVTKSRRISSIAEYVSLTSPNEAELIEMMIALSPSRYDPYSCQKLENTREKLSIENLLEILKPAIFGLLEKGITLVVVTLGSDGVFLCSREVSKFSEAYLKSSGSGKQLYERLHQSFLSRQTICTKTDEQRHVHSYILHLPAPPASVVSLTGAGDCLVGGTSASICAGLNVMQSVAVGMSAAKAAVETEFNVPYQYNTAEIAGDVKCILSAAKLFLL